MSEMVEWLNGDNAKTRIISFFQEMDKEFIPSLSSRVDIPSYAAKLAELADTIFITNNIGQDIASCSIYCNQRDAYISSIAVKKSYQGKGIGHMIMDEVKAHIKNRCGAIVLHVHISNRNAIYYYKKNDFKEKQINADWIEMIYYAR
ncbi:MAG: N-acetyltransferase [Anaerovibrio sp.]|nr:N-acetyltransferase [Anaerovibrio sp.]